MLCKTWSKPTSSMAAKSGPGTAPYTGEAQTSPATTGNRLCHTVRLQAGRPRGGAGHPSQLAKPPLIRVMTGQTSPPYPRHWATADALGRGRRPLAHSSQDKPSLRPDQACATELPNNPIGAPVAAAGRIGPSASLLVCRPLRTTTVWSSRRVGLARSGCATPYKTGPLQNETGPILRWPGRLTSPRGPC